MLRLSLRKERQKHDSTIGEFFDLQCTLSEDLRHSDEFEFLCRDVYKGQQGR